MDYHSMNREQMHDIFAERMRHENAIWNMQSEASSARWSTIGLPSCSAESLQLFCFTVVSAYILYFLISFIIKPSLGREDSESKGSPAVQQLLAHRRFQDNVVPAKLKNLYEVAPLSYEKSTSCKVLPEDEGDWASADMSKPLLADSSDLTEGETCSQDSRIQNI